MILRLLRITFAHPALKLFTLVLAWGIWIAYTDESSRGEEGTLDVPLQFDPPGTRAVVPAENLPGIRGGPAPVLRLRIRGSPAALARAANRKTRGYVDISQVLPGTREAEVPIDLIRLPSDVQIDDEPRFVRIVFPR